MIYINERKYIKDFVSPTSETIESWLCQAIKQRGANVILITNGLLNSSDFDYLLFRNNLIRQIFFIVQILPFKTMTRFSKDDIIV